MYDGVVLYTTPSLTAVLGFPKDMWLGRSFIDFVHPKDRETFSSQVTTGIALPLVDSQGKYKGKSINNLTAHKLTPLINHFRCEKLPLRLPEEIPRIEVFRIWRGGEGSFLSGIPAYSYL